MQLPRLPSDRRLRLACVMLYWEAGGVWVVAFAGLAVLWRNKDEWGCWFDTSGQKIKLVVAGRGEVGVVFD